MCSEYKLPPRPQPAKDDPHYLFGGTWNRIEEEMAGMSFLVDTFEAADSYHERLGKRRKQEG